MNQIIVIGNIVRDPESKMLASGNTLTSFTVAVNRKPKNDGVAETDYFSCTAFGKVGTDVIEKYAKKGTKVLVKGRMESATKEKEGVKTTYWGIVVDVFELLSQKTRTDDTAETRKTIEFDPGDEKLPF